MSTLLPPGTQPRLVADTPSAEPTASGSTGVAARPSRRGSAQRYALLVVVAVAIPLALLITVLQYQELLRAESIAREDTQRIADIAAADADLLIERTAEMLRVLARDPGAHGTRCGAVFGELPALLPELHSLTLFDPAGSPMCASAAGTPWVAFAGTPEFLRARAGERSAIVPGARAAGEGPDVAVAVPVHDSAGAVSGVLVGGVELAPLLRRFERTTLVPAGFSVTITKAGGARSASKAGLADGLPAEIENSRPSIASEGRGSWHDAGKDVFHAVSPMRTMPWYSMASTPAAPQLGSARQGIYNQALVLGGVVAAVLFAAISAIRRVTRPLESLVAIVRGVADGNADLRADTGGQAAEIDVIAGEINRMLDRLQRDVRVSSESKQDFRQLDVQEPVEAGEGLRRLNSLCDVLAKSNEAIAGSRDASALFERVCNIIVEHGQLEAAWLGLVDPTGRRVQRVASAGSGMPIAGRDTAALALDAPDAAEASPPQRVLLTGRLYVGNDSQGGADDQAMGEMLAAHGLRSSASLPLRCDGRMVGVLSVFSADREYFSGDLLRLLLLLADDLSFALDSFAGMATRARAEAALRDMNASLERRVLERTRLLELANRELEAFSYSVSHDLRAPLRSIHGFAELLDEAAGAHLDADARKYVQRIKAGASRMALLIEQLLQLSRVSRAELNVGLVDLSMLAREVVTDLAESEPTRKVEVSIAEGLVAHADAGLARIVLNNLIGNAWKFTSKTGDARIEFGAERGPSGAPLRFYVKDNGAGFDPEHAHKLFAPFQRLHAEREFPGTGIGLALVQRILLRHGGEARAEGKVGGGATIRFSFATRP